MYLVFINSTSHVAIDGEVYKRREKKTRMESSVKWAKSGKGGKWETVPEDEAEKLEKRLQELRIVPPDTAE